MKVKIKDGCLVIRIPLGELPSTALWTVHSDSVLPRAKKPKPAPVVHSEECLGLRHREALFAKEFPVHCRTCAAKGWIAGAEGQKRTCPRCLEFGLCPRCGNPALTKVSGEEGTFAICPGCDWNQFQAMSRKAGAAEAAGLTAPVWRCECSTKEETDA